MMEKLWIVCTLLVMWSSQGRAQVIINSFAKIDAIVGSTLTVSAVEESGVSFDVGERVIVIQMQDDVIGPNTNNDSDFGNIESIENAGRYEEGVILSVDRSAGLISMTLEEPLVNSYSIGANASLQVLTYPSYSDYTTTDDLTTLAWNGNVGGVFAIHVEGTLTLGHDIDVSNLGFRGAAVHAVGSGATCDPNTYFVDSDQFGLKGEGVYKVTLADYVAGRGKIANGGGGGNPHNAGGGGGANFTAGGEGGPGYNGSAGGCSPTVGGLGGYDLSDYISGSRVFMGGGGGSGHQNNNVATAGGNGGGIAFLTANTIELESGCGGVVVSANGSDTAAAGNDGAGGSGAGGMVVFTVNTWALNCDLTVQANGGNGGATNNGTTHGGGAGGGRGAIVFSGMIPASNLITENTQGNGGANNNSGTGGNADSGEITPSNPAADPDGIVAEESGPLPVSLLYWKASESGRSVVLEWATALEQDNDYFTLDKSRDAENWQFVARINGAGDSSEKKRYSHVDSSPYQTTYYRLTQTDSDGTTEVFDLVMLKSQFAEANILLYPNPNQGSFRIGMTEMDYSLTMHRMSGQMVAPVVHREGNELVVYTEGLQPGFYFVNLTIRDNVHVFKVLVE
ncbi:hypothetical protein BFP72_13730 [Reichenbachiella sp. 5M10]|uniref:T9SS type A sorting domain-containing protein n=1 Tax=Reichenbachiella sp. 5M10 TaxID=1889772 RepID=UPI000C15A9EF|nr:T9SS type A sorting domain-containing protein [Reichenbachiella sp. 5M10]PIB36379.1 hypothetical protein BFP72_13730 [Reichenbachiella sp. 5M10]